jgi:hypothetical protein
MSDGMDISMTDLNTYLEKNVSNFGGMEKDSVKNEWRQLVYDAINGKKVDTKNTSVVNSTGNTVDTKGGKSNVGGNTVEDLTKKQADLAVVAGAAALNNKTGGASAAKNSTEY